MICTLVSCSSQKETEEEKKSGGTDLSTLDGEFLYRHGEEKMKALKSALYTTKVLDGEEELGEFETVRIRKGYDGFQYSRRGQGFYSFDGERAYTENDLGAFTAPTTLRVFEEYLTNYVFPVCGLTADLLENFQRDGDTVTYESKNEGLLSLYRLAEQPDFIPTSMTGSARFNEEGVILEESIILKDEEKELTLETVLSDFRSDSIAVSQPTSPEAYVEVEDIRLPARLQDAIDALYAQKEIQTTGVISHTVNLGGAKYVYSQDVNTYAKEDAGAYYICRQTLKTVPELPEESVFYQALLSGGKKNENRYNVILGEKVWDNSEAANTLDWESEVKAIVPALSDFATMSMTEEVGGYSVSFTLTDEAAKRIASDVAASFGENGVTLQAATVRSAAGTLSIDNARGILTAISYTAEGGFAGAAGTGDYTGRFSVLLDRTEGVTLPEMQVPTATTPGMVDHNAPIPEC